MNSTENIQWHFPVYPVWDCKCSLKSFLQRQLHCKVFTQQKHNSASSVFKTNHAPKWSSAVFKWLPHVNMLRLVNLVNPCTIESIVSSNLKSVSTEVRALTIQLPLNSIPNVQSICRVPISVMSYAKRTKVFEILSEFLHWMLSAALPWGRCW